MTLGPVQRVDQRSEPREICVEEIDILQCVPRLLEWRFKSVEMLDCSPSGIGIISDMPLQIGDQFLVKLELETISLPLYTVKHCTPIGKALYKIGARFTPVADSAAFTGKRESLLHRFFTR
jgi:hypothetical protein